MVFIYWGWDTALAVNEETKDKTKTPGRAAIISTVILLVTYALVITSIQAFAGVGTKGNGLGNPDNFGDVLSVQGNAIFGGSGIGPFFLRLLFLMILSSAAASTQTTILPTARTTLSMAAYKAMPSAFAKIHPRHLTPTVSTITMGGISIVLYAVMNYLSAGTVIADAVTGVGLWIAFYYGLTGFACAWYYRAQPVQQRAQPVDAGHPAGGWRAHPVRARRLEPLAGHRWHEEQLHVVDAAVQPALADRRRVHHHILLRRRRLARLPLLPDDRARVLQEGNPDQGHPDLGPGRVARPGGGRPGRAPPA